MEPPTEPSNSAEPTTSPEVAASPGPPVEKTSRAFLAAALVPTMVGLVASTVLLVDYLRPAPVFCEPGAGCDALKATSYAWHFGIPTPAFGLAGFVALGALSLLRGARARTTHVVVAVLAAVVGVYLVTVQAKLGTYCKFCIAADGSAALLACLAVVRSLVGVDAPRSRPLSFASVGAMALAVAVPGLAGAVVKPKVPDAIAAELAKTPPGQITVVDFVDFQCPFCRMTNQAFSPMVAEHRERVRLVRKHVPLAMHSHARDAARAACCGERLGKGDQVAEALFTTDDLSVEGCEKIAVAAGVDPAAYRACLADPETDERIRADTTDFRASQGRGLPTIWIERQKLEGAQPEEKLRKALDTALAD